MKIIIISGFLGAGKTRFIKEMVKKTGKQFAILENEFSHLGLDGTLLQTSSEPTDQPDMKVWELTEGCICCSPNLDFTYSILTIANAVKPDYLLIEPSGVAWPTRILRQLNKLSYEHIKLASPITIIDAQHYENSRAQFTDYFQDQLSVAGTVVVSKSEALSQADFIALKQDLQIKENVEFPTAHYSQWTQDQWLELLNQEMEIKQQNNNLQLTFHKISLEKPQQFENIGLQQIQLHNIDQLAYALFLLTTPICGQVIRVKGYCQLGNSWAKFDLVDNQYAITGCEPMPDQRIVVIGQKLKKSLISQLFTIK